MNEDLARRRFFVIGLIRLFGVAMILTAILIVYRRINWPIEAGYVLGLVGIVDAFVAPRMLAKKWRSERL